MTASMKYTTYKRISSLNQAFSRYLAFCQLRHHFRTVRSSVKAMFQIVEKPIIGRCLIATKDIEPGELILRDESAVHGPKDQDIDRCLQCLCSSSELICIACLKDHSLSEMQELLSKLPPVELRQACVTPLRLLLAQRKDKELARHLDLLMDHREERKEAMKEREERMINLMKNVLEAHELESFRRCIGLLKVNAVNVEGKSGRALFPTFSFLSHSCVNNARHVINRENDGLSIKVYSQRKILKGEEITITYVNLMRPTAMRRRMLKDYWYFTCCCSRCDSKDELGSGIADVQCPFCSKDILRRKSDDLWECSACLESVGDEAINRLNEDLLQLLHSTPINIDKLRDLIKIAGQCCGQRHFVLVIAHRYLMQLLEPSEEKADLCRQLLDTFDILDAGVSQSRGLTLIELTKCEADLGKLGKTEIAERTKEISKCIAVESEDSLSGKRLKSYISWTQTCFP